MIELRGVSFAVPGGRELLRSIGLSIEDGAWVAVAGGNGSGKTTLCRIIAGLQHPSEGDVSVDGGDPSSAASTPSVGLAFQNPDSQFVTTSVEREILFGMENLGLDPREMGARLDSISSAFGLAGLLDRNPHTLSGGEKQRLVLAGLIAMGPRHLVLDEPFSFLDGESRSAFLESLRGSLRGTSRTVVWSTVDEEELALAERVVFLHEGSVLYDGPPSGLDSAIPDNILGASLVRTKEDTGEFRSDGSQGGAGKRPELETAAFPPPVEIRGAGFSWPDSAFSLSIEDLSIAKGEMTLITGPSGSGKTTLLLGCSGLLPPRSGTAAVLGRRIGSRRDAPVGRFALLFQSPEQGFCAPTVREEIAIAHRALHGGVGVGEAVEAALARIDLAPAAFLDRNPFGLSQGEKRLVALASALVIGAELVLLDEPTIFLDGAARARLRDVLLDLRRGGTTVIAASHDTRFFEPLCDRIIPLK